MSKESFEIKSYSFRQGAINELASEDKREENWPVVYQIFNDDKIYIGETTNLKNRMGQHLANDEKASLRNGNVRVVFDESFNKSVALDLESYLIQYFSGDGKYKILNHNDGMCDRDYFDRSSYREKFEAIWNRLRELKVADKTIAEINNSELFKFSPYKNLNFEQLKVVTDVLFNIDEAIAKDRKSLSIIGGDAGTGKTIVIMYLAKLIADLQTFDNKNDDIDDESNFGIFFEKELFNKRFKNKKIALVIPQTSLRGRIETIFKKSGLGDADFRIFSPIEFGKQKDDFDITLVDEAHLLKIGGYNMQGTALQTVKRINQDLFGDDKVHTELDWIMKKSKNVVMVFSDKQRIRPGNITEKEDLFKYMEQFNGRSYYLHDQMRSKGGRGYIDYINCIFSNSLHPQRKEHFGDFELKLFTDFRRFQSVIKKKDEEFGLSRMIAGFAWKWNTKKDYDNQYDIEIEGVKLKWNSTLDNYLGSERSKDEVGSIYTVQGDDLNYAGVIIGEDLIYRKGKLRFNREKYADKGAVRRNSRQVLNGEEIDENELLNQVLRIYKVLLSRAIKGVYIYVCDAKLREYLSRYFEVVQ